MKSIKNLKRLLLLSIILTGNVIIFNSCTKQLDQQAQTTLTDEQFWKTANDLLLGTNYLYTFLPDFNTPLEDANGGLTMNVFAGTLNTTSDGSWTVPATSSDWSNPYKLIRAANNILEKSVSINDNPDLVTYCIAQARFFRALGYYMLVRKYGDVPYIDRALGMTDTLVYGKRTPREQVIDSVYADLDFAAANCPQADEIAGSTTQAADAGKEYGRITRGAAFALEARIALMEGTWDKFHGGADPAPHLQKAITASKAIIDEQKYQLYQGDGANSYQTLFRYAAETYANSKEVILARLYGQNLSNNISSESYSRNPTTDGTNAATRTYVKLALYSDGLPSGKSPLDSSGKETGLLTDYNNRDPRMVLSLFKVGDPYVSITNTTNLTYGNTFYYQQQKYWIKEDFSTGYGFLDFMIIRYAEVLLDYAEATFELNGKISDADLDATINLLRRRATNNDDSKLPPLTNEFVTSNGLDMRTEIRRERTIELAFEGLYYWDLLRWKTAETVMPQALLERKYFPGLYGAGTQPPTLDANGYILMEASDKRKFDPSKDYLWPIPSQEIGLSKGNLTQNPGWGD